MKSCLLVCVVVFAACAPQKSPEQPAGPGVELLDEGEVLPIDHPPVVALDAGAVDAGAVDAGARPPSAWSQRLSVRQLAASMPIALGGNTWLINTSNGFTVRGPTLGEPDYIGVVDENLEPTALYLKFMADAARDGCTRAVNADAALAANQRVLLRFVSPDDSVATNATAVDRNLRYLKLRFHGVKLAEGDTASISRMRALFDTAARVGTDGGSLSQANVREGWRAVCVALLMAPEYHLY
jgi:hypothetical protein